ncbi:MAG TPA: ATP-binding protein [bacterium]|nr:ATP-binding protein [bacterium]
MDPVTLLVRVDKSHLVTIGERLYAESVELIRELVNNAYDADASEVHVSITDEAIRVQDNGLGMDFDGLREYFTIGTSDKRVHPKSPRFGRPRIGQFGIGKFATLSACGRFTVATQQGSFAAEVIFDKNDWERAGDRWDLPLQMLPPDPARGPGTTVTLSQLFRRFDPAEVERRLVESVPLRAPDFAVFLNGRRVSAQRLPGHRIPFLEGTAFGPVHGEVVIVPAHLASTSDPGIEIKVKQVTVRRDLFGMPGWGSEAARIKGEVHADFLPVTADRSGFLKDRDEYRAFLEVMDRVLVEVRRALGHLSDRKERQRTRQAVREAFRRIQLALAKNPDLSPFGPVPYARATGALGGTGVLSEQRTEHAAPEEAAVEEVPPASPDAAATGGPGAGPPPAPPRRKRAPRVRRLTPNAVVQRVRLGEAGVTCCLDHFGVDGREAFSEGSTIYINRDHPLYIRNSRRRETHTLHVARLLAQEVSMMKDSRSPRQAFERQSKLLRDAFIEDDPAL